MEKVLRDLEVTWAAMEVRYETHARTGVPQLRADEELIELLEDNQVQLQNMMSSRFIAHFLEEVMQAERLRFLQFPINLLTNLF